MEINKVYQMILHNKFTELELVSILELTILQLDAKTMSDMARSENKSPNGIRFSKRYPKIKTNSVILCYKPKTYE